MKKTSSATFILIVLTMLSVFGGVGTGYFYRETEKLSKDLAEANKQIDAVNQKLADKIAEPKETGIKPAGEKTSNKEVKSESGNTIVTSPGENDVIGNPVKISGSAIAFENTVNIRIKDKNGKVLTETYATTDGDIGEFGDFEALVEFEKSDAGEGAVEVYQISAEDGSEDDKVIIPVKFAK